MTVLEFLCLLAGIVLLIIGGVNHVVWMVIVGIIMMAIGGCTLLFVDVDDVFSWFDD